MRSRQRITIVVAGLALCCMFGILVIRTDLDVTNILPEDYDPANKPVIHRKFLNKDVHRASSESRNNNAGAANNNNNPSVQQNAVKAGSTSSSTTTTTTTPVPKESESERDTFSDLFKYTVWNKNFRLLLVPPRFRLPKENPSLQELLGVYPNPPLFSWQLFQLNIRKLDLYRENDPIVDGLLEDIATQKVIACEQYPGGTQIKLAFTFQNGGRALFKPMRFPRDTETLPNHFYFNDFERHHSEIATYHLDRILGFRRAPPVIGRLVNISSEILPFADKEFRKTFYISPAKNLCFFGECKYYCDSSHAICGNPYMLEGSMAAFMPPKAVLRREPVISPWRRSYTRNRKADWESDPHYCDKLKKSPPYNHGRRLYDLMDLATLDFLIGNQDRHHYENMYVFGHDNESFFIHWDNGRGFGRPNDDDITILYPILQCCVYRLSTFNRLYEIHNGPEKLSQLMEKSMSKDPLYPILTEAHLKSLDRRVGMILAAIRTCLLNYPASEVFLDDLPEEPVTPESHEKEITKDDDDIDADTPS